MLERDDCVIIRRLRCHSDGSLDFDDKPGERGRRNVTVCCDKQQSVL